MRQFLYLTILWSLTGCPDNAKTKKITIGTYSFDFPLDFDLITKTGIDSYVGQIKNDSIVLNFDYGNYSGSFAQTEQEYIDEKSWLHEAGSQFMKVGTIYDMNNYPKVELLSLRKATKFDSVQFKDADFIAKCKHDSLIFDYPIFTPDIIKRYFVKIDTIKNHLRRIVIAKNPAKGFTQIYLSDLTKSDNSLNQTALSIFASDLTKKQQDKVLKIFSTAHFATPN